MTTLSSNDDFIAGLERGSKGAKKAVPQDPIFDREAYEERAAIAEFCGHLSRTEAEALAKLEDHAARKRHKP